MMKIANSLQMRELDRITIEDTGIPGDVLMENAGRNTAEVVCDFFPDIFDRCVIVCGPGNNGGDGYVISRHLFNRGYDVAVLAATKPSGLKGSARVFADVAANIKIPVHVFDDMDKEAVRHLLNDADVVIDALFGTGFRGPLDERFTFLVNTINAANAFVVSVDIPSGMPSDSCVLIGPTVQADLTVTFGLPKPALLMYPSAKYAGDVVVSDISIPQANIDALNLPGDILTPAAFPAFFEPREPDSYKGKHGHLLVIAGSPGKTGAAIMASQAAAQAGTGLVTAAIPFPLNTILETRLTEVMTLPLSGSEFHFSRHHADDALEATAGKSALLIGPGIGTHIDTIQFLQELLPRVSIPVVLDADALTVLSMMPSIGKDNAIPAVLTPHPGEFSRLCGLSVDRIMSDPLAPASEYAIRHCCIVVLKTARSVIAFPDGTYSINVTGNPGLASGGSGDILAGIIAGLLAQKMSPRQAVSAGVFWHGLTADIAAERLGQKNMMATDLLTWMGKTRRLVCENIKCFNAFQIPFDIPGFLMDQEIKARF